MISCKACVCGAVLIGLCIGVPGEVAEAQGHGPVTRVEALLATSETLSAVARTAMQQEADTIWRQQGVVIDWLQPTVVRSVAPNRLRVLVVDQRPGHVAPKNEFSVGELVRSLGTHPVALVSIASARRLIASVRGRAGYELIAVDDRRLGVVLGRALAHEIGHFLLDTPTHARRGLMRPHFDAIEFTDLRDGLFALDEAASAWLRAGGVEKFAYAVR